jgi:hypothetical protein
LPFGKNGRRSSPKRAIKKPSGKHLTFKLSIL